MSVHDPRTLTRRTVLQASAGLAALPAVARAGVPVSAPGAAPARSALQDDLPQAEIVAANTAFALDLYAQLRQQAGGNLFCSPYSVSLALAMTFAGAAGDTAAQMASTLHLPGDDEDPHPALGALTADLVARGTFDADPDEGQASGALRVANALWGEQTFPFNEDYLAQLEDDYDAGLQETDFRNAPEEARDEINDWVAARTDDHIQDIVPERGITPDTRLVLANAIYFQGSWLSPFSPESTEDDAFHLLDGEPVTVPFMVQRLHLPYASGEGYQAFELHYAGAESDASGFAFMVILPDEGEFERFEQDLDTNALRQIVDALAWEEVDLSLPRFEFDYGDSLVGALQALGMTDAFDPERADFSGMVDPSASEPLAIGDVLHKAFVGVDENGTVAAAATIVEMAAGSAPMEDEPPTVRVDRPFVFAIRDEETGTILFLGRVLDPSS